MTSKGHADTLLLESLTKGTPSSGVQFSKVSFALPKGRGYSWVRLLEDDKASTQHVYRSWVKFPVQNRSWALYKSFVFPRYTKTVRCVMICPCFLYWSHFWFPPEELYKIAESFCSRPNCWKILDVASEKKNMLQEIMMWLTFLYYTHCICIYKYREQHVQKWIHFHACIHPYIHTSIVIHTPIHTFMHACCMHQYNTASIALCQGDVTYRWNHVGYIDAYTHSTYLGYIST